MGNTCTNYVTKTSCVIFKLWIQLECLPSVIPGDRAGCFEPLYNSRTLRLYELLDMLEINLNCCMFQAHTALLYHSGRSEVKRSGNFKRSLERGRIWGDPRRVYHLSVWISYIYVVSWKNSYFMQSMLVLFYMKKCHDLITFFFWKTKKFHLLLTNQHTYRRLQILHWHIAPTEPIPPPQTTTLTLCKVHSAIHCL